MSYAPKEGTGWEEGSSPFGDVRRWQTPLDDETALRVTVTATEALFVVARVRGWEHTVPSLGDLGRIERDFEVPAWRILGVSPPVPPATGQALLAQAVAT